MPLSRRGGAWGTDRHVGGAVDVQAYVEVLGREECLRLLPSVPVGWLTYCDGDEPQVVPVNFAVDGDEVVVRSGYGGKLAAGARGAVMALAVSALDPCRPHRLVGGGARDGPPPRGHRPRRRRVARRAVTVGARREGVRRRPAGGGGLRAPARPSRYGLLTHRRSQGPRGGPRPARHGCLDAAAAAGRSPAGARSERRRPSSRPPSATPCRAPRTPAQHPQRICLPRRWRARRRGRAGGNGVETVGGATRRRPESKK